MILTIIGALVASCPAQKSVTFLRLGRDILKQRVDLHPATQQDRLATLRKLFSDGGCQVHEQPVPKKSPNLLCFTRGTSDSVIVVLAPFDYSSKGDDATVQWGDLVMLPILAESIGSVLTRHSFVFLAESGAGKDQPGPTAYLEALMPKQRKNIHAVVALDHIGRAWTTYSIPGSPFGFDLRNGSPKWDPSQLPLTRSIPAAATRWSFPVPYKDDGYGSNDAKPFVHENIPAITFSSPRSTAVYVGDRPVTRELHTSLNLDEYNKTYLFLSVYLLLLDQDLGQSLPALLPESLAPSAPPQPN